MPYTPKRQEEFTLFRNIPVVAHAHVYLSPPKHVWPHLELSANWPNRVHSRFLELDGVRWHYQQLGNGPEVLLVHGTGGSAHSWAVCAEALSKKFTVIVTDLPGHGFTFVPTAVERARNIYSINGMAGALQQLLDALRIGRGKL